MVRVYPYRFKAPQRGAFTLIELIISITILAIVLLSLPPLFSSTSQNIEEVLKAEALNMAYTRNENIISYYWDEHSYDKNEKRNFILDTQGDRELDRYPNTSSVYRRTAAPYPGRRKFFPNVTNATLYNKLGTDTNESDITKYDDIDDFNNYTQIVHKNRGDYVIDFQLISQVYYVDDSTDYSQQVVSITITPTAMNRSTSIKMVETKADVGGNTIMVLRNFLCNIGETSLETKTY